MQALHTFMIYVFMFETSVYSGSLWLWSSLKGRLLLNLTNKNVFIIDLVMSKASISTQTILLFLLALSILLSDVLHSEGKYLFLVKSTSESKTLQLMVYTFLSYHYKVENKLWLSIPMSYMYASYMYVTWIVF